MRAAAFEAGPRSRIVFVAGDSGVGKSRLLLECRSRVERRSTCLIGRGSPLGASIPFSLFAEALQSHLRTMPAAEVAALCEGRITSLASVLPSVAASPGAAPPSRLEMLDAFACLLQQFAAERPLVLMLDDVHQADPSTFEVLDYLGRNPLPAAVLVVAATRTTELGRVAGSLLKDGLAEELRLAPLDREQVASLASTVLGAGNADTELTDWLFERTRGNPLFAVALLEEISEDPSRRVVPVSVKERVRAMTGTLPADGREVLELAAVLGHPFSLATMDGLAPTGARGLGWLDDLTEQGYLVERDALFDFTHPLVQEALYEGMGASRRNELHARVARWAESEPLAVRAFHAARGARPGDESSIDLIVAAAREAEEQQSHREALTHLQAALSLMPAAARERRIELLKEIAWQAGLASDHSIGIPALRELERLVPSDPAQLGAVKIQLASFLATGAGDLSEAGRLARKAVSLFEGAGLSEYVPGALNELAWIRGEAGDLKGQVEGSREAVRLVREAKDANQGPYPLGNLGHGLALVELHALGALGHGLALLGRTDEAVETGRTALSMAEATGEREQIGWHTGTLSQALVFGGRLGEAADLLDPFLEQEPSVSDVAYFASAWLNLMVGRWPEALSDCRHVQAMHPTAPSVHSGWTLSLAGLLLVLTGRPAEAKPDLGMADRLYGDRDFYIFSAMHRWAAGCAAWLTGDAVRGRDRMRRAVEWAMTIGAVPVAAQMLPDLVEADLELGEVETAAQQVRRLSAAAKGLGDSLSRAATGYASALVAAGRGRAASPEGFREAAALADEAGARFLAARALERLGVATEDVEILADAGRRYARLPAALHEERVVTALRSAGAKGTRAAQGVGALTRREEQVSALAGRGLSDREIADRLRVSVRTVESHLARVYSKLGIAGRREL